MTTVFEGEAELPWIGQCREMRALWDKVQQVTRLRTRRMPPVLLIGETGTGKGLLAKQLHELGPRRNGPWVEVNCASIPESLLEGELFGYAAGAFTDAKRAKPGLLETANGGTLLLDEVGLLPGPMQGKLLKVLDERSVRRLGETQCRSLDLWVIAATNEDLKGNVRKGLFRRDLYHRLGVITLKTPPLRERGSDMLLLATYWLQEACRKYGLGERRFSADAAQLLTVYRWPGNVREMANVIEHAVVLSRGPDVTAALLREAGVDGDEEAQPSGSADSASERVSTETPEEHGCERLREALEATQWNVSRAARQLGISRFAMARRMKRHHLMRPPGVRGAAVGRQPAPVTGATAASDDMADACANYDHARAAVEVAYPDGSRNETGSETGSSIDAITDQLVVTRYRYLSTQVGRWTEQRTITISDIERLIESAEACGDIGMAIEGYCVLGEAYLNRGQAHEAVKSAQRATALCEAHDGQAGWMGRAWAIVGLGYILQYNWDGGLTSAWEVSKWGKRLDDRSLQSAGFWLTGLALLGKSRDGAPAIQACREAVRVAGRGVNRAVALGWLGYVLAESGEVAEGAAWLQSSMKTLHGQGSSVAFGLLLMRMAERHLSECTA